MMRCFSILSLAMATTLAAHAQRALRLNQIQVIGTHNSYHAGFAPSEAKLWQGKNDRMYRSLEYRHPALTTQLDAGVGQVEIDVFADPEGGRYAHPLGVQMVAAAGLPADPSYDPDHQMEKPGFKVMHIQDVDQRSTCATFVLCLQQIHGWSKAHPDHLPIFILVETKQGGLKEMPQAKVALPFTAATFDALDAEALSVFSRDEMVTPDQVRGSYATLPEAIAQDGWPTLKQARGKVVFLLDQRSAEPIYTEGHTALRGRIMFPNATPGAPDAAFTEQNDGTPAAIDALVAKGYLVRTRTDEPTEQARSNDTTRRDTVLSSGAQMLSTDYPKSEPSQWTGYSVSFPGGAMARCDPKNTGPGCHL